MSERWGEGIPDFETRPEKKDSDYEKFKPAPLCQLCMDSGRNSCEYLEKLKKYQNRKLLGKFLQANKNGLYMECPNLDVIE